MSFFGHARRAAAEEYGRHRAEQYGRAARVRSALAILAALLLGVCVIIAAQGGFGG